MSKHTPGNWHVSEFCASGDRSADYIFIEPGVAVIERKVAGQDQNDMADAHLIAAAPELLEALRGVLLWGTDTNYVKADEAVNAARAVIQKATGGQQ